MEEPGPIDALDDAADGDAEEEACAVGAVVSSFNGGPFGRVVAVDDDEAPFVFGCGPARRGTVPGLLSVGGPEDERRWV